MAEFTHSYFRMDEDGESSWGNPTSFPQHATLGFPEVGQMQLWISVGILPVLTIVILRQRFANLLAFI